MYRIAIFLLLNFGALGLGSYLMGGNPGANTWYQGLRKAPWTPPGWVFGAAWTTIMLCFSFFMAHISSEMDASQNAWIYALFILQWILNVGWNPVFFRWHSMGFGLFIIIALTLVVGWFLWIGFWKFNLWGLLMLPYFVWLCIATSLNGYVVIKN